jgi:hypothetical protein
MKVYKQEIYMNSEGAGRRRGAPAAYVEFGPFGKGSNMKVAYASDGTHFPAAGVRGGGNAAKAQQYKIDKFGKKIKMIARFPQYEAINLILQRVEENKINLQLEEDIPPSPTMLETFVKITIEYPWIAIFAILMLTASALTYIRTRNASNVDLEFAFEDIEDVAEETKEDVFEEESGEEEDLPTHDELMKNRQIKRKIGRKKSQSDSESTIGGSYGDEDVAEPVVVRRRSASVKRSRDGTVVTGKRTTLSSGNERATSVTTKKVATKKAAVKTRRVVTSQNDDQVMDDALDRLTKDE